jgi:hypothetical protein
MPAPASRPPAVASCDGAQEREQSEPEQHGMGTVEAAEGCIRANITVPTQAVVQAERLDNEQHEGEQGPDTHHGVHPPVVNGPEPAPEIEPHHHVQTRGSGKQYHESRMPHESAFDSLECAAPIIAPFTSAYSRKDDSCDHRDTADLERLIGTLRREYLDQTFFWNSLDLHRKLLQFAAYYNERVFMLVVGHPSSDAGTLQVNRQS